MEGNSTTPPEHPTFGIDITDQSIELLIKSCVAEPLETFHISRLSHQLSYNNKIYIISAQSPTQNHQAYVLKANGRFYGAAKVENEVISLLLLEKFCPDIPVPRVIAWSEDGAEIRRTDGVNVPADNNLKDKNVPGWILMTHLPGSVVDAWKLSPSEKKDLSSQLAYSLASWRQSIPPSGCSASLHFKPRDLERPKADLYQVGVLNGRDVFVYGFVDSGNHAGPSASSLVNHWQTVLGWQIKRLSTDPIYAPNCEALLTPLQNFVEMTLPELSIFKQASQPAFVLTDTDFFPRNVLVQGSPARLSGIVDFEFAGFYPPMAEFVQDWLPEDDGSQWPSDMYEMMLGELKRLGEATPRDMEPIAFSEVSFLHELEDQIAPWWLRETDATGNEQLSGELLRARKAVENILTVLEQLVQDYKRKNALQQPLDVKYG